MMYSRIFAHSSAFRRTFGLRHGMDSLCCLGFFLIAERRIGFMFIVSCCDCVDVPVCPFPRHALATNIVAFQEIDGFRRMRCLTVKREFAEHCSLNRLAAHRILIATFTQRRL
jgi:hypothetical protein